MASLDLTICNLALAQVPAAGITSTNERSLAAGAVTLAYPQCLDELLEQHPWRFARKRQVLAAIVNDRSKEWYAAYALPSDLVEVQTLLRDPNVTTATNHCVKHGYEVAGGNVYSDLPGVVLEYTSDAVDPGEFPAGFRNALIMSLAARVVMPILKSRERQGDLIKAAQGALNRAVADDLNSAPSREMDFVPYDMRARYDHDRWAD